MSNADAKITVDLDTATEFLDYIRPSKNHWKVGVRGKHRWVFRGQSDSTWGLTPSAWRKDPQTKRQMQLLSTIGHDRLFDFDLLLDRCHLTVPGRIAQVNLQSEFELRMLQEFLAHANVAGLTIPHDTVQVDFASLGFIAKAHDCSMGECGEFRICTNPFFDRVLQSQSLDIPDDVLTQLELEPDIRIFAFMAEGGLPEIKRLKTRWPYLTNFTMHHSIAALAQHHGIPTRLLDWSYDSRKAAFFACHGVNDDVRSMRDRRIALFAINPFMLKNRFLYENSLLPKIEDDLSVEVYLSRHSVFFEKTRTTSYILAQDGLFTYPEHADLYFLFKGCYPDICTSILRKTEWETKHNSRNDILFPPTDYIRQLTLPYSEVDVLLEMLDDERIMLTTLMPSLDKMKECMLERATRKIRLKPE